jgi:hypothetical protein
MAKKHKWAFVARFRAGAYGWRGSALASKRLKEAITEIKKFVRTDAVLAADGVVNFAAESANAGTLARAARDFVKSNPEWALQVAVMFLTPFST